jgi:hypothetical protein
MQRLPLNLKIIMKILLDLVRQLLRAVMGASPLITCVGHPPLPSSTRLYTVRNVIADPGRIASICEKSNIATSGLGIVARADRPGRTTDIEGTEAEWRV